MKRFAHNLSSLVVISSIIFPGCNAFKRPHSPRPVTPESRPVERDRTVGPERMASDRIIDEGLQSMDAENYLQAADRFQEAINVDTGNGAAYFYYATAKYQLSEMAPASAALDKAEQLLAGDTDWQERINDLRQRIVIPQTSEY